MGFQRPVGSQKPIGCLKGSGIPLGLVSPSLMAMGFQRPADWRRELGPGFFLRPWGATLPDSLGPWDPPRT